MTTTTHADAIVIRHATDADIRTLADLATLDSREPLTGPALIAEVDGVARAALDLHDGSVAADPFAPTAELVELLRLHAGDPHRQPYRPRLGARSRRLVHATGRRPCIGHVRGVRHVADRSPRADAPVHPMPAGSTVGRRCGLPAGSHPPAPRHPPVARVRGGVLHMMRSAHRTGRLHLAGRRSAGALRPRRARRRPGAPSRRPYVVLTTVDRERADGRRGCRAGASPPTSPSRPRRRARRGAARTGRLTTSCWSPSAAGA